MPTSLSVWNPSPAIIHQANITRFIAELNLPQDVASFHRWTVASYETFWQKIVDKFGIVFKSKPTAVCDLSAGIESPHWFPGSTLNIIDSCLAAPSQAIALIYQDQQKRLHTLTYGELATLSNQVANSLVKLGIQPGDAVAIVMPMHVHAVAIYLGIIKMGGVVVSIADSFSDKEMAVRFNIANTKLVFTQDVILRSEKKLPLYEKIKQAQAPRTIVLSHELSVFNTQPTVTVSKPDMPWHEFLVKDTQFDSVACDPMAAANILFSSGTTATPKAIVWNHTTPIKCASDAFFHQNIKTDDILAWPTNLGWMMGPWLIFAAFINRAALALCTDVPKDRSFGEFIERAKVTMLGVVPTLVAGWRQSRCMEQLDWSAIRVFSSTGECSNPEDMSYLMSLAKHKPIIEYCGGTEIGGAYVSSTVVQTNYPSQFSTPTMGLNFVILNEQGRLADIGEVAIVPPSIGLSTVLLNADHHQVYYAGMPTTPEGQPLRRHGDQIERLANGYYTILGRIDDTMNLGGIKTSSAEIERALIGIEAIQEVAAIAVSPPNNGPSLLVIYAATDADLNKTTVLQAMQTKLNQQVNPLFRIYDVVFIKELPKTASNKIMRRVLRDQYQII